MIFCMPVLSLFPQQIIGSRCTPGVTHDWLGYKSPDQMAVGRALGWSLDLDRYWIWIVVGFGVSLVLEYRRRLLRLPFTWLYIASFLSLHNTDLHHTFAIIIR